MVVGSKSKDYDDKLPLIAGTYRQCRPQMRSVIMLLEWQSRGHAIITKNPR